MFIAFPLNPSFVDMPKIQGFAFRKSAFTAIVTQVSVTAFASFARVFPVAGKTSDAVIFLFADKVSAPAIVVIIG
jgi:hypothetical protein